MPRRPRVDEASLQAAALGVLRQRGLGGLTVGSLAEALGIKPPSLYNHISGVDEVRRRLRVHGLERLGEVVGDAVMGKSGAEALRALANAWREFARAEPALYALTVETVEGTDEAVRAAGDHILKPVLAVVAGCQVPETDLIHVARGLRASVHGFVALELAGGFGLPDSVEESFARLVDMLIRSVVSRPWQPAGAGGH